jgi:isopenicillin N synthase-like dioxygenase
MTPTRYSIPIFSKPRWDAVLEPMPGYENGEWKRQTFLEFYQEKMAEGINSAVEDSKL